MFFSKNSENYNCSIFVLLFTILPNGLRLGEGGDFHHKCSYEVQMFV